MCKYSMVLCVLDWSFKYAHIICNDIYRYTLCHICVFSIIAVDKEYHLLVQEVSTGGSLQKPGVKVPHIPPKPVVSQGQVGLLMCSLPCLEDPLFPRV